MEMKELLANLIKNAVDEHLPDGSTVTVRVPTLDPCDAAYRIIFTAPDGKRLGYEITDAVVVRHFCKASSGYVSGLEAMALQLGGYPVLEAHWKPSLTQEGRDGCRMIADQFLQDWQDSF